MGALIASAGAAVGLGGEMGVAGRNARFRRLILALWVGGFIGGMSLLGATCGSGFQMRFVLPATPALAVLVAEAATTKTMTVLTTSATVARPASQPLSTLAAAGLLIGAAHCLYFGVLFAPLYAELGGVGDHPVDVWVLAATARGTTVPYPLPDDIQRALGVLGHFGIQLRA